jgi:hypothetical protein
MFESLIHRTLWSNHGPRIGANAYLIRFWEPPASRIFNQLPVNRVLSRRKRGFESLWGRKLIQLLPRDFVALHGLPLLLIIAIIAGN